MRDLPNYITKEYWFKDRLKRSTVFRRINAPGAEAQNELLTLSDLDEIHWYMNIDENLIGIGSVVFEI